MYVNAQDLQVGDVIRCGNGPAERRRITEVTRTREGLTSVAVAYDSGEPAGLVIFPRGYRVDRASTRPEAEQNG